MATLFAALLAAAATALVSSGRTAHEGSTEASRIERARLAAEALVADATVELDAGNTDLPLDGSVARLAHQAAPGEVRLQDAAGLMDLNGAQPPQLAALFAALGVAPQDAAVLADRVADWRGPANLKRLLGADDADYAAAGLPAPAHRPFRQELEIGQVLGMSAALARCLEPYVTVYSGSPTIDVARAPAFLKRAAGLGDVTGSELGLGAPLGHVIIIHAAAPISPHAAYVLKEWVRLTGDPRAPVMIHRAASQLEPLPAPPPPARCPAPPPMEGRPS